MIPRLIAAHAGHHSAISQSVALALAACVALLACARSSTDPPLSSGEPLRAAQSAAPAAFAQPAYASALRPKLQQIFTHTLTPGAVVLVRSPELGDWTATFGTRALGSADPVTLGDHVRIGSNTKTWTGTVILLALYAQALVGGGLLDDAMQKQRLASIRPIDPADPKSPGYGLALAQFGPVFGHTGELPGYNSFMGHDPRRSITVIVWCSLAAAPDGRAPAVEMARAIIGHLYAGQIP